MNLIDYLDYLKEDELVYLRALIKRIKERINENPKASKSGRNLVQGEDGQGT